MDVALPQPGVIYTLAMFLMVISALVFIHEMGHYLAGRVFGVKATSFSIGFGREILGWTDKRGTRWKLSLMPLGGYVKFLGDLNASSQPSPEVAAMPPEEQAKTFLAKPRWQRAIIIAAGPITNFLFAILVFASFFGIHGHPYTPPVVDQIVADSPAAAAGLRKGDRIVTLDGQNVDRFEDIVRIVVINPGHALDARIERGGRVVETGVTPATIVEKDRFGNVYTVGQLGVAGGAPVVKDCNPAEAVYYAVEETALMTRMMAETLVQVISGRRSVKELGGPVKIAQLSGQQAVMGWQNLLYFMTLVSINLGFINLLPVPVLDGGHLFLYAIEGVRRRPLDPRVQEWAFKSGFALLISLMLFLTVNDLASLSLWQHLASLFG